MATVWEKFDKAIDTKALKEDVQTAAENNQEYKEVPHGKYVVKINKLELVESKSGKPMVSCWMKIIEGDYEGSMIFMNQVVHVGFGIRKANEFLRSLDSGIEIEFVNFKQYHEMLLDVHEAVDEKLEYTIEYGEEKGYNTFKVLEVFEAE